MSSFMNFQRIVMLCALILNMTLAIVALIRSHRYDLSLIRAKSDLDEIAPEGSPQLSVSMHVPIQFVHYRLSRLSWRHNICIRLKLLSVHFNE